MVPKILQGENYFESCFQLLKNNDLGQFEKSQQVYLSEKQGKTTSTIRNTVNHDVENLGLVLIYEAKSGKESTMDQEVANYNKVNEISTYNMRRVCLTIKKYSVNKSPYIQIRRLAAKKNKAMKQVVYLN